MTPALALEIGLAALIVGVAAWTIAARDTFAAVVGFVVYGMLIALGWLALHAPDVAFAEAAIGSGLTGVLFIGAASRLAAAEAQSAAEQPSIPVRVVAALLAVAVAAGLAAAVLALPEPAPTLAPAATEAIAATGLGNAVSATLLAYRATDTLLEKVVLLLGLVGLWSLAPDGLWGGRPGPQYRVDPDGVLAFLARVLPPVGIVVGVYLVWFGADQPGGAFPGATIVAAMWLLVMMAGLADAPATGLSRLRLLLVAGPIFFLAVGFAGIWLAGAFLAYPAGYAKAIIVAVEVPLVLSVAATLALLLAGAPAREVPR
jgi:multisubunit Na+/H+ antiporter MnhB subunit